MSKKLIIILVVLAILVTGGLFVYMQFQSMQKQQTYDSSADRVADDFLNALRANDVKASMKDHSSFMLEDYSEQYWKTTVFEDIGGFKDWPKLVSKGPVQPASPDVPNRYDPQLNQQATEYVYEFKVSNATYRLMLLIFHLDNGWKINELSGGYLP